MTRSDGAELTLISEAVETPLGGLILVTDTNGILRAADFADCEPRMHRLLGRRLSTVSYQVSAGTVPNAIKGAVAAYFAGDLAAIDTITVAGSGTEFQESVWNALRSITPGSPVAYGDLATRLGHRGAARAVGLANGANPFCIIIPCHRLIGANGTLTGYSGGVERKRWLLNHEAIRA